MTNVTHSVRGAVEDHPSATALEGSGERYTYRELWIDAGRFAGGLREYGIKSDDAVAIVLPNVPAFVVSLLGTLRNGSVAVPVPTHYDPDDKAAIVRAVDADVAVVLDEEVDSLLSKVSGLEAVVRVGEGTSFGVAFEEFVDTDGLHDFWEVIARDGVDPAVVSYAGRRTPPTTGAILSHDALRSNATAVADVVPGGIGPEDTQLSVLPSFHLFNVVPALLATLVSGATYRSLEDRHVDPTLEELAAGDVSVFHDVRSMYAELDRSNALASADLSGLRVAGCLGGPFPPGVPEVLRERGCESCYQLYGRTETGPIALATDADVGENCLGRPIPGVDVRIVDETFADLPRVPHGSDDVSPSQCGELVVASDALADGYYGGAGLEAEAFTTDDGVRWFHTGVTAYRDAEGYVYAAET